MVDPQSYAAADALLTGRNSQRRKIANNTWLERRPDGSIAARLHDTDVVTWTTDGRVEFRTGGWNTVTTRERFNRYAPEGLGFGTIKRVLYAYAGSWDNKITASEGMSVRRSDVTDVRHGPDLVEASPSPVRRTPVAPPLPRAAWFHDRDEAYHGPYASHGKFAAELLDA